MIRPLRIALALALAVLAGCKGAERAEQPAPPSPALYEIASPDGTVEGWLFGTMHRLTDDTEWRTPAFDRIADGADILVVEVAGLDDPKAINAVYARLAPAARPLPLAERVAPEKRDALESLIDKAGLDESALRANDTWAVALALGSALAIGDAANGADRALIMEFADRPRRELEGAAAQLAIFENLPEADQRDLLNSVIDESIEGPGAKRALAEDWRMGRLDRIEAELDQGMLADPELRQALLVARNRAWAERLSIMFAGQPRALIAVGAAHLPGSEGLVALLEQEGYTLRRIQ